MYLVSKAKLGLWITAIFLLTFGSLLLLTPKRADALPVEATKITTLASAQKPQAPTVLLSTVAARPQIGCGTAGGVPIVGGFLSGGCDTIVSAVSGVADAAGGAVECASNPTSCLTDWLLEQSAKGADWGVKMVLDLVINARDECLPAGGSANWNSSTSIACDTRISQDYFFASGGVARTVDSVAKQKAKQIRTISSQITIARAQNPPDTQRVADLQTQLNALTGSDNLNASQKAALAGEPCADKPENPNCTFFTPKSAITSRTFNREYKKFVLIGILLLVPMVIAGALQSVITGKPSVMLRSVFLHLPAAVIGMFVARYLVRTLMALTDAFSAFIISDVRDDVEGFFGGAQGNLQATATVLMPSIIIALVFLFAAILVWFVLSMREASVAIISVFLPIAFAASVWPALGKWILRAIKLLMAAIISKVFIVGALSLGIGTFSHATSSAGDTVSLSHMIYGATIFFIAAFSPHLVMKFFDEIGDALNAAGGTGALQRGLSASGNTNGTRQLFASGKGGGNVNALTGGGGGGGGGTAGGGPGGGGGGGGGPTVRQARKAISADRKAATSPMARMGRLALAMTPPGAAIMGIAGIARYTRERSAARRLVRGG